MQNNNKKAALAAMMCMAMAVPFSANAENETRVITCGTLNLRAEAGTDAAILGKYGWGTEVEVLGFNGNWAYVEVGGQTGYMYSQYLGKEGSALYTAYVKTNTRGLNLRAEPNGMILGSYPRGTKVSVLSSENGWSKVLYNGGTAYIFSEYLSTTRPVVTAPEVDYAKLIREIAMANGLRRLDYTKECWGVLTDALTQATSALNSDKQATVDNCEKKHKLLGSCNSCVVSRFCR